MRRTINYVGAVPLETDLLSLNKNVMVALGHVLQDMLGTSTLFSGLGCVPTGPAGMTVNVNPGRAYSLQATDTGAYSSLSADARTIVKQGISLDVVNFACPAPGTAGFSINYLIQGAFQEVDGGSVVLPYYNASNPATAYSGPNNTGTSNTTYRDNTVQLQLKAGTAATTGSQVTPTPDSGFTGLWVVTVAFGQVTITSTSISQYVGATFLSAPLLTQIQNAPAGVVGSSRNASMSILAASATATFSAGQIIAATANGGQSFLLPNFSKTINLATTGAGGMDVGSAPTSGYVALYAIYNPTTATAALLATNATSAVQNNVYGGANMPSGYTASALISVWPTNGSGQFSTGYQMDRTVAITSVSVLSTSTTQATPTALSIVAAVPPNARTVSGTMAAASTSSTPNTSIIVYATSIGMGVQGVNNSVGAAGGISASFRNLMISTSQTLYYSATSTIGTPTFTMTVTGYEF